MFKLMLLALISICIPTLQTLSVTAALAGACLAQDPDFTQCETIARQPF